MLALSCFRHVVSKSLFQNPLAMGKNKNAINARYAVHARQTPACAQILNFLYGRCDVM
jgi:hypothetical protein